MKLSLRNAFKKDEKDIARILVESYNIDSFEEGIHVFRSEKEKGWNFLVAVTEGRVVGLLSWAMKGLPKHGLIELDRIAVAQDFRGKGVAAKLFGFMEEKAKDFFSLKGSRLRKLFLFTHEDNTAAISFYKKMGMQVDAVLKDHYYKGKNELVMRKFFE
jgi:ribosomal protein S18 acetylase RimI-like enzyme